MAGAVPFIPAAISLASSLIKGKKQKYTTEQTPEQRAAYNQLLKMIQSRMGQPSAGMGAGNDAMNILYSQFLKKPFIPMTYGRPSLPPATGQQGAGPNWQG